MKEINDLEEFVKAHKEEFDYLEPSPGVWENIRKNQKKSKVLRFNSYFVRVAASAVIVIVASAVLVTSNLFRSDTIAGVENPEIKELIETEAFYANQVDGKLNEIRKCYSTFPEIKDEIENDLNELETMYKMMKNDLNDNISNKAVIEAMIENSRYRLKLVDAVLEQIDC